VILTEETRSTRAKQLQNRKKRARRKRNRKKGEGRKEQEEKTSPLSEIFLIFLFLGTVRIEVFYRKFSHYSGL
jgi:hypothetical protein